ncbi:hypothetical protein Tco_1106044 [Tanacetum coccineum]
MIVTLGISIAWSHCKPRFVFESFRFVLVFVEAAKASMSVTISLVWIVDSERDRLIFVDRGTRSVPLFVDRETRSVPLFVDRGTRSVPFSLIPLSRGSFDMIVGMERLSKRKFAKVCHEKVVRIPLESDGILRVHGERTQGVVKTLMNAKVDELKLSDISVEKGRMKPRRVRAVAMTIQYRVRGMILAVQSEVFKQENVLAERLHGKEWNSGEDQLRLRWMIYLVVLADAAESVRDTIGFEYCLASSSGWTKLRLPEELSCVHDTFHVSNLEKKCLADASLHVSLDEIKVDKTLRFVEEPVENSDREVKRLKCSRMVVVKLYCYAYPFGGQAKLVLAEDILESLVGIQKELNLLVKSRDEISLRRGYCDNHDLSSCKASGTDIAKITRKWSKPDKHEHGNGKSAQELEVF